ncbi:MAG: hypothetical protein RJA40_825 [Actinomycetota bacterium]|jgi:hypothetical protein
MENEDESEINLQEKRHEQELISRFFRLIRNERSRYESQALTLIENGTFEKVTDNFELSYRVKGETYSCRIRNKNRNGNSYEMELPIPDSEVKRIETLIELFAQSEAKSTD